uniref:Tubulin tyrosine ligase-like family, member 2 n=1 Tax=Poecilia latipinna TaxID=48699 RepID=A0A3B3VDZ7_9TELE
MRCNVCLFLEEVCLLPAEVLVPQAAADLFCSRPNQKTSQTDAQPQSQPQRPALSRFIPEKHVREVLLERGWKEYDKRKREDRDWNLYWRRSEFHSSEYHSLLPWQRLNHHPKTAGITRKDSLVRNLRRMKATFGSALYNFSPTTFILPNEYTSFLAEYNKLLPNRERSVCWICKPVDLSRGRGIFLFRDIKDLVYNCSVVVQRYISNPLLISGYKFDLRIYVCVKSFNPLTVYIHQEALVRFATEKYNLSSLSNVFAHLTNTSINKRGPFYKTQKGQVGSGCKWTMSKFRYFLQNQNINEPFLWQRINNIVTLTLLSITPSVPDCPNCVELFGFDILIDSKFKPWLLEVNHSPSLTLDCQTDLSVKKGLISDLVDLMNYTPIDGLRYKAYQTQRNVQTSFNANISTPVPSLPKLKDSNFQQKNEKSSKHEKTKRHLPPIETLHWILVKPPIGQHVPPIRAGGFIRTFPFNPATLKASRVKLDVPVVLQELQKLTARVASGRLEETTGEGEEEDEDCFDSLLWGPEDPLLLSQWFNTKT